MQEQHDATVECDVHYSTANDATKTEPLSPDVQQCIEENENMSLPRHSDRSSHSASAGCESTSSNRQQFVENMPETSTSLLEKRSSTRTKSPSEDADSLSPNEESDAGQIKDASTSTKETDVVEAVAEPTYDSIVHHDDSSIRSPLNLEADIVHVPAPHQASVLPSDPPMQTPLSSSKVRALCINMRFFVWYLDG